MLDLKKLQEMQQQMQEQIGAMQEKMAHETVEVASGGGAVKIVMNGKQEMQSITIAPEAIDPEDPEMLQDLVMAAVNAAVEKSREMSENEMGSIAGGMLPPGMNLPF
jgi:hypothetical protein